MGLASIDPRRPAIPLVDCVHLAMPILNSIPQIDAQYVSMQINSIAIMRDNRTVECIFFIAMVVVVDDCE
ncbi:hypothetical protein ACHAXH_005083 [Discostella pseudostelligera]